MGPLFGVAGLLLAGVAVAQTSSTGISTGAIRPSWAATHNQHTCQLTRQIESADALLVVSFIWRAAPARLDSNQQIMVAVSTPSYDIEGPAWIRAGSHGLELTRPKNAPSRAAHTSSEPGAAALLDTFRNQTQLTVTFQDATGANRSLIVDDSGLAVAGAMFDTCVKAVSPNNSLERTRYG